MKKEVEQTMLRSGYRFCQVQPEGIGVYYKYYQEGFHVVMTLDFTQQVVTAEQHQVLENHVLNMFYHPNGVLADFPDGFPVYHVEILTLILCKDTGLARELCNARTNIWVYEMAEKRLFIYENQPGDFFGLRSALESQMQTRTSKSMKNLPFITAGIALANVLVYVVLELMGDTRNAFFIASHGGMYPEFLTYNQQWWLLFTAMFLHFGLDHLINNMVIFCCVGSRLERAVGHVKMLIIYLLSGICGGLLSYTMMMLSGDYAVSAGASGAVFGTIGGLLWAVIFHRGRFEGLTTKGLLLMIVLSLYYGFATMGVDNWSHIGGMIAGFVITMILYHRKSQKY